MSPTNLPRRSAAMLLCNALIASIALWNAAPASAQDAPLALWKAAAIRVAAPHPDRHVIHSYFNTAPESPDGRFLLYYTSAARTGELGDLRIRDRLNDQESIIATGIVTEDAHRAACQQWSNGGKTVVYHDCHDGRWCVVAIDIATRESRILTDDRQLGFGAPATPWVPIYGCHWNPGPHRDLQLVNSQTGEIRTAVAAADVVAEYRSWIETKFHTTDVSLFFPVLSPDAHRVFFKIARPSGGNDFRSSAASYRDGKVVFDLEHRGFLRLIEQWGHPSWTPDGTGIFEKGNYVTHVVTGVKTPRFAPSCFSDHPSLSPDGALFTTDADVSKRPMGKPGQWAIAVGSTVADEFVVLDTFDNAKGATSWRHNHPHPAFSPDGRRVYYNVNRGPWTELMVAGRSAR